MRAILALEGRAKDGGICRDINLQAKQLDRMPEDVNTLPACSINEKPFDKLTSGNIFGETQLDGTIKY